MQGGKHPFSQVVGSTERGFKSQAAQQISLPAKVSERRVLGTVASYERKLSFLSTSSKSGRVSSYLNVQAEQIKMNGWIYVEIGSLPRMSHVLHGGWFVPILGTHSKLLDNRFKFWTDMNWAAHANLYRWISPFHRVQTEPREDRERWIALLKFRSTALTAYFWTVNFTA